MSFGKNTISDAVFCSIPDSLIDHYEQRIEFAALTGSVPSSVV